MTSDAAPAALNTAASGPAVMISKDPLIISTASDPRQPLGLAAILGHRSPQRPVVFLVAIFWCCEDDREISARVEAAREYRSRLPHHEIVFLGNTLDETRRFTAAGAAAFFANHNIFASEETFTPLQGECVAFDAVYVARPSRGKRHELAAEIGSVLYFGSVSEGSEAFHSRDIVTSLLERPGHVLINPIVGGFPRGVDRSEVNRGLARAAVGLCMSEVEGAMFASMEYMLAGLPIVSTPSRGGRDVFFDPDYCVIAEPTPRAVREAVEALRDRNIPREYVRARTLAKLAVERQRFLSFVEEIRLRYGVPRTYATEWTLSGAPFHKWRSVEKHAREFFGTG